MCVTTKAYWAVRGLSFFPPRSARKVHMADWVREEEIPVERRERVVQPASPTFSPAQLAHIDALMAAKVAELGLERQDVTA